MDMSALFVAHAELYCWFVQMAASFCEASGETFILVEVKVLFGVQSTAYLL